MGQPAQRDILPTPILTIHERVNSEYYSLNPVYYSLNLVMSDYFEVEECLQEALSYKRAHLKASL